MPYFVAIHQQARPDGIAAFLASIKDGLAASRTLRPDRRSARVFQRIDAPTRFLALSEWANADAYRRFERSSDYLDAVSQAGSPPRIEPLALLRSFERVEQRIGVAACSTITATPEMMGDVLAYLLGDAHHEVTHARGFISRELYRSHAHAARLLLVHCWRSLDDLEQFRDRYSARTELGRLGATTERFTGTLAARFSIHDR